VRLAAEVIGFTLNHIPKWNPINICSYHLQESGATPVQELAFTLANACTVLDTVKDHGAVSPEDFPRVVGRISFFLNAGIRFIEEMCKVRVFTDMWDHLCKDRYNVEDPKMRRFRYGLQVNSLGLTGLQPENNVARIIYEFLGVVLSKKARARSVQLPAWNEALGLPRKWDQQWSLRLQQIMAYETDLLEYEDLFDGSEVVARKEKEMREAAEAEFQKIMDMGGAIRALETGYMKQHLVKSNAERLNDIETGERIVVGLNKFEEGEPSPLVDGLSNAFLKVDASAETEQIETLQHYRNKRDSSKVGFALESLVKEVKAGGNIMEASITCADAGVTTGEWTDTLREVFGEYRAPTGISGVPASRKTIEETRSVQHKVKQLSTELGRNLKILIGKPGLDGHSNGAEQIAIKARDVGMEVIYEGIRLSPEQIAESALQEDVHVIGLSILSGSHLSLVPAVVRCLAERGLGNLPIVLGGIIPGDDVKKMDADVIRRVYSPTDYNLNSIMSDIAEIVAEANQIPFSGDSG